MHFLRLDGTHYTACLPAVTILFHYVSIFVLIPSSFHFFLFLLFVFHFIPTSFLHYPFFILISFFLRCVFYTSTSILHFHPISPLFTSAYILFSYSFLFLFSWFFLSSIFLPCFLFFFTILCLSRLFLVPFLELFFSCFYNFISNLLCL